MTELFKSEFIVKRLTPEDSRGITGDYNEDWAFLLKAISELSRQYFAEVASEGVYCPDSKIGGQAYAFDEILNAVKHGALVASGNENEVDAEKRIWHWGGER